MLLMMMMRILITLLNCNYQLYCSQWEVASLCLGVLRKLLHVYDIQLEHFTDQVMESGSGTVVVNKPAGFNILLHMLKDSRLFQMVGNCCHKLGFESSYPPANKA